MAVYTDKKLLNICVMNHCLFATRTGFLFAALLLTGLFAAPQAQAADYTVCSTGCDFPTLTAALQSPGLGTTPDTLTVDSTYTFDDSQEDNALSIPDNITILCEAGANTLGETGSTEWFFDGGNNMTWQDCTFENMAWDYTGNDNVNILHNTWTTNPSNLFVLTAATNVTFRDNIDIQRIQIQTAHDVLIENNTFASRYDNTMLYVGVAGGPDYSDPAQVSGDVTVQNNVFNNYLATNGGDWVNINGGNNIIFQNNIVQSQVTLNDTYLTMINISNGQAEFKNNYILQPVKSAPQNAATVAFNLRTDLYNTDALYEYNTIIRRNGDTPGANQNSCFTLFDGGGHPNIPMHITANYNLCHQEGSTARGQGFQLQYVVGSSNVTVSDSFNGFSMIDAPMQDTTNSFTEVNANSVLRKALFKLENVDTSDDLELNPVSVQLDADGTTDIGAYSATRSTTMLIDDDCAIDYVTCHGHDTDLMIDALKDGDNVTIAAGTYSSVAIHDRNNITVTGAGADSTLIDGGGGTRGLHLHNVQDSHFSDIAIKNATTGTQDYLLTMDTLSTATADYNTFGIVLWMDAGCSSTPITPNLLTHIYTFTDVGTQNINALLVHIPGVEQFITIIGSASVLPSANALATMCGVPDSFIEYSLLPLFSLSGSEYTVNTTDLNAQGIFSTGLGPLPVLNHEATASSGLSFFESNNNTLTRMLSTDNNRGIEFHGTSANNFILDSDISGNSSNDIFVSNVGNNFLDDSVFDPARFLYDDTGTITVRYKARALAQHASTGAPIEGASVTFTSNTNAVVGPFLTDTSGLTAYTTPLSGIVLSQTNPTGVNTGGNPYTLAVTKNGFNDRAVTTNITSPATSVTVALTPTTSTPPLFSGGGGGFGIPVPASSPVPSNGNQNSPDALVPNPVNGNDGFHAAAPTDMTSLLQNFPGFPDLAKTEPSYIAFAYAYTIGAMTGDEDGNLHPRMLLQRDQMAKMVATSILHMDKTLDYCDGAAPFPDVPRDNWAAQYICFGKNKGILTGYKGDDDFGLYRPERTVSRAELIAILTRAIPSIKTMGSTQTYQDIIAPDAWYNPIAAIAYELQLFPIQRPFGADRPIRRIEAARILYSLHLEGLLP